MSHSLRILASIVFFLLSKTGFAAEPTPPLPGGLPEGVYFPVPAATDITEEQCQLAMRSQYYSSTNNYNYAHDFCFLRSLKTLKALAKQTGIDLRGLDMKCGTEDDRAGQVIIRYPPEYTKFRFHIAAFGAVNGKRLVMDPIGGKLKLRTIAQWAKVHAHGFKLQYVKPGGLTVYSRPPRGTVYLSRAPLHQNGVRFERPATGRDNIYKLNWLGKACNKMTREIRQLERQGKYPFPSNWKEKQADILLQIKENKMKTQEKIVAQEAGVLAPFTMSPLGGLGGLAVPALIGPLLPEVSPEETNE